MARRPPPAARLALLGLLGCCGAWPECLHTEEPSRESAFSEGDVPSRRLASNASCASSAAGQYSAGGGVLWELSVHGNKIRAKRVNGSSDVSTRSSFVGQLFDGCLGAVLVENKHRTFSEVFQVQPGGITWGSSGHWARLGGSKVLHEDTEFSLDEYDQDEAVSVTVSFMLFVTLTMMICIMYLWRNKDDDIRENSMEMVGETLSVFCGVMLNQAVFSVLVDQVIEGRCPKLIGIQGNHMLNGSVCIGVGVVFWIILLQVAWASRNSTKSYFKCGCRAREKPDKDKNDAERLQARKNRAHAVCHLGGHCVAFAGIMASSEFLRSGSHADDGTYGLTSMTFVATALLMNLMRSACKKYRQEQIKPTSEYEKEFYEHFLECMDHGEIQAIVLVLSFISNQLLCKAILNKLPTLHGSEKDLDLRHICYMWIAGCCFVVIQLVVHVVLPKLGRPRVSHYFLVNFLAMSMSWCFQWASLWSMEHMFQNMEQVTADLCKVMNAFAVSVFSVACMFPLDWIADSFKAADQRRQAELNDAFSSIGVEIRELGQGIRGIMLAFGLLVALSWDKAFDAAIETCVEGMGYLSSLAGMATHKVIYKCILCLTLVFMVAPAWYYYIVPDLCEMEEKRSQHEAPGRPIHGGEGRVAIDDCEIPLQCSRREDESNSSSEEEESDR